MHFVKRIPKVPHSVQFEDSKVVTMATHDFKQTPDDEDWSPPCVSREIQLVAESRRKDKIHHVYMGGVVENFILGLTFDLSGVR